jgi:hypothetical protein
MDSKVFEKYYLEYEDDKDILNTQYVLISNRVRSNGSRKNVISMKSSLYPDSYTMMANDEDEFNTLYRNQLELCMEELAEVIYGGLKNNWTIVFICSENENNLNFLDILAGYVYKTFKYPIYDYEDLIKGRYKPLKVNEEKIMKTLKIIVKKSRKVNFKKSMCSQNGRLNLLKYIKKTHDKKTLKKFLYMYDEYEEGMSYKDMLESANYIVRQGIDPV